VTAVTDTETGATVSGQLKHSRDQVTEAEHILTERPPKLAELHAAVDGAMQVTTALADLVATVIRQAPAALNPTHAQVLQELLADLHATHGRLTTAPLLLAPARDDLHHLITGNHHPSPADHDVHDGEKGPAMLDEKPLNDVADQQRLARPDTASDESSPEDIDITEIMEADPADVADQHRSAPVISDDEPWP
jgi:hypothetical protein